MNVKVIAIAGGAAVGIGLGVGGYFLWKKRRDDGWKPSFAKERIEQFDQEPRYDIYDGDGADDGINDPKLYSQPPVAKPSYDDGKPPIGKVAADLAAKKYMTPFNVVTETDEDGNPVAGRFHWGGQDDDGDVPPEVKADSDEEETEEVTEAAENMPWEEGIEPISLDQYLNEEPFFDKINCVWFRDEHILAGGENLEKMDPEDTVGLKAIALLEAGHREPPDAKDPSVMVRCRQEGVDYQLYCAAEGLTYEDAFMDAVGKEA